MGESVDIRRAVRSILVSNRHLQNFKIQLRGAEQEIEVAEGIEVAEIVSVCHETKIVVPKQHFGSAQRIFDPLIEQPRERHAEKLIPQ